MDDIRIEDLLAWEPRLQVVDHGPAQGLDRPVSWAVAARTLPPVLPKLRGGEIVLFPAVVLSEQEVPVPQLLAELAQQRVAAAVVDASFTRRAFPVCAPVMILGMHRASVSLDVESELNRLLTQHRGENYRLGTELGRLLSNLTATGAGLQQVLDVTFQEAALPAFVTDRTGIVLAASEAAEAGLERLRFDPETGDPNLIAHPLRGGGRLWLGPVPPAQRAVARVAADRVAVAAEAALTGANWFRSRGPERADALTRFVLSAARRDPSDARVRAVALGLDPAASFRVALSPQAQALQSLSRSYASLGVVHDLSDLAGLRAVLIEIKPERSGTRLRELESRVPSQAATVDEDDESWIAQSAPVSGLQDLTEATRQAGYVAGLLSRGLIRRSLARFDRATEMGAYRLLYRFWGSGDLAAFAAEILGDLVANDRNGTLRQTLLHFLESGGSRVEAAARAAIHRNTLAYRLRRIAELTRLDPNVPDDRLSLHLAILAQSIPARTETESLAAESMS